MKLCCMIIRLLYWLRNNETLCLSSCPRVSKKFLTKLIVFQGRMILAHICDEPKGLKTSMCMVRAMLNSSIEFFMTFNKDD